MRTLFRSAHLVNAVIYWFEIEIANFGANPFKISVAKKGLRSRVTRG